MDIAGAKALKERLGLKGAEEAPTSAARADLPPGAPPVFHWAGVSRTPSESSRADIDDAAATDDGSLFSRLGLSFR